MIMVMCKHPTFYRKAIEKHREKSGIHKAIIRKLKSTREVLEEDLASFVNPDEEMYPETSRVLRIVYHGVQSLFLSFKALARLVALFVYHHVEIGLGCRSDHVHTDMTRSLGTSMHDRLVHHVQTMETPCALVIGNDANNFEPSFHSVRVKPKETESFCRLSA